MYNLAAPLPALASYRTRTHELLRILAYFILTTILFKLEVSLCSSRFHRIKHSKSLNSLSLVKGSFCRLSSSLTWTPSTPRIALQMQWNAGPPIIGASTGGRAVSLSGAAFPDNNLQPSFMLSNRFDRQRVRVLEVAV